MKDFWGDTWLTNYHRSFLTVMNELNSGIYTQEGFQNRIQSLIGDKTFEKFNDYIKKIE